MFCLELFCEGRFGIVFVVGRTCLSIPAWVQFCVPFGSVKAQKFDPGNTLNKEISLKDKRSKNDGIIL